MIKVNNLYRRYAMLSFDARPMNADADNNDNTLQQTVNPSLIQNQVLVEGDNSDLNVDSSLIQDDNNNVTVDSFVTDNTTGNGISLNTVIVNNTMPIICSQIIASNTTLGATKWALTTLNGEILYTSDDFPSESTCIINLNNTNIEANTQLKLKALNNGNEPTSSVILVFGSDSNNSTAFILKGSPLKASISYLGVTTI